MHSTTFFKYLVAVFFLTGLLLTPTFSLGASFVAINDSLSDYTVSKTNATHTIDFTTITASNLQQITLTFSTAENGDAKPAGLDLSSATLPSTTNLGTGWSLSTASVSTGVLTLTRATADPVAASIAATIALDHITNSALGDCEPDSKKLSDNCFVKITTYSDLGTTEVDSGSTTYTVIEDPSISFQIKPVASGQTHNGITTTVASTTTTLPFGKIVSGVVEYIAQELAIQTNAPSGYTVYMYVEHDLRGSTPANTIEPFGAINATWDNPQPWQQPTGTSSNHDSGWLGANTTDTRVNAAWADGAYLFGPVSIAPHPVAFSDSADRTGSSIFVTYALSVNSLQQPDSYSTNLVYDVRPTY